MSCQINLNESIKFKSKLNQSYFFTCLKCYFLIILLFIAIQAVESYSGGAPQAACTTLIPKHNADPQRFFTSPFRISVYRLGNNEHGREFNVSIFSNQDAFKGFILQARDFYNPENLIVDGTFTPNLFTKVIKCKSILPNTLTHNSPSDKQYTSVIWKPSDEFRDGRFIFRATVVLNVKVFWTIDSEAFEVKPDNDSPVVLADSYRTEANAARLNSPDYIPCKNKSQFCVGFPNNCIENEDCVILFKSYSSYNSQFVFELIGYDKTSTKNNNHIGFEGRYVSIGLSNDQNMGDDLVFSCLKVKNDLRPKSELSYNEPDYNNRVSSFRNAKSIKSLSANLINGKLTCKWQLDYDVSFEKKHYNLLNDYYFILLAKGNLDGDSDIKTQHETVMSSESKVQLKSVGIVSSKRKVKTLVKMHGSLMVIAWIYLSPLAIMLARYYKNCWEDKTIMGVKIWFFFHRGLNILVITAGCVGTVAIFVNVGGWRANSYHQYFGLVANVFMIFQPINAMFRCGPQDDNRWIFNRLHALCGNIAYFSAFVAILLASSLTSINLPNYFNSILVFYLLFYISVQVVIQISSYYFTKKAQKEDIPMRDINIQRSAIVKSNEGNFLKKFFLFLCIFVTSILTAALIYIIVRNP